MIQKAISKKTIDLNAKKMIFAIKIINLDIEEMASIVKMIDLNTKMIAEKTMIAFIFEINSGNIYMAIALIN